MAINRTTVLLSVLLVALGSLGCNAFTSPSLQSSKSSIAHQTCPSPSFPIYMSSTTDSEKKPAKKEARPNYQPKWKKKATLAEGLGEVSTEDKGLDGAVPITFQSGTGESATLIQTSAVPGQSLKEVASQAGQFIKYGCGKGECGTCEALCNGKYLRPCIDVVPTDLEPDPETGKYAELVLQVKKTKAKVVSSGKFFTARSFVLGFWNNFLGMFAFVRDRRKAKKNWEERMSKEDAIKALTEEKRRKRAEAAARESAQ